MDPTREREERLKAQQEASGRVPGRPLTLAEYSADLGLGPAQGVTIAEQVERRMDQLLDELAKLRALQAALKDNPQFEAFTKMLRGMRGF